MSLLPNTDIHRATPTLTVIDPRMLDIRTVGYHRTSTDQKPEARVTRRAFTAGGHEEAKWDPRLWERKSRPNTTILLSLSGQLLQSDSVDAGWRTRLLGVASELLCEWDKRLNQRRFEYDLLRRTIAITENTGMQFSSVTERMTYADANIEFTPHNQCGRLIRHDDPAGCLRKNEYGLSGSPLNVSRRFMNNLLPVDWPSALAERDKKLELETATTQWQFNAAGDLLVQADARGNQQIRGYDVAGQLEQVKLKYKDSPGKKLLDISYNAHGQIEREIMGNGVETLWRYEPDNNRLLQLSSRLPNRALQNLLYAYDSIGNITCIRDLTQDIRYFRNRRIEPASIFKYDPLYQLTEATGRESIPAMQGPQLPARQTPTIDPKVMAPYKQTFIYDPAGNLLNLTHEGSTGYTQSMAIAPLSNRSLLKPKDGEPDFSAYFDENGNATRLFPAGQIMRWNVRNQLAEVVQVEREVEESDAEQYRYDSEGQRVRKTLTRKVKSGMSSSEVRYLDGLEIHIEGSQDKSYIITVTAGHSSIRIVREEQGSGLIDQTELTRYCINDHLGSCSLEVDEVGDLLSQEGYYPFGGTAWWAARNETYAKYKTIRYSGKERDATGLYYYGYRYYAPWLMRWISPDPDDDIDGVNLFLFTRNNPICRIDNDGRKSEKPDIKISRLQYWLAKIVPVSLISSKRMATTFKLPPDFSNQPLVLGPTGNYERGSGFNVKRMDAREAEKSLMTFEEKYREVRVLMQRQNLASPGLEPWNSDDFDNINKGVERAELDRNQLRHSNVGVFKLIDSKNNIHAISITSKENSNLNIDLVIAHPYSQLRNLDTQKRQEIVQKIGDFNEFSTQGAGRTIALLSVVKEIKYSPKRIKTISTVAINPRSKRLVTKVLQQRA
jgi:insecticidal toxin complex protein TccC